MPVSTIALIKELVRQSITGDDKYLNRYLHFFELQFPPAALAKIPTNIMFPLILPPENYVMEEPFTAELTNTMGGGLWAEENGIVQRVIRIEGTTGFRPRQLKTVGYHKAALLRAERKSYSRELNTGLLVAGLKFSGQKHFQYLQDTIFRTYGDFKQDPARSELTKLIYHNPKDDEHWVVVPQRFSLRRDKGDPTLYRYSIELWAVEPAEKVDKDFSEDKPWLDQAKDILRTVKSGIDMVTGALNDLTAMAGEVKRAVTNFIEIQDSVTRILDAANDFVNGVTDVINVPYAFVESTMALVESAGRLADKLRTDNGFRWDDKPANDMRRLNDGLEQFGLNPQVFSTSNKQTMTLIRENQELKRKLSSEDLEERIAETPPSNYEDLEDLGTGLTPGEAQALNADLLAGGELLEFTSAQPLEVGAGDTLASLAAQYLGDARLWQYIAVANGLKPPYVSSLANLPLSSLDNDESPFGSSLGVGSTILIPSNAASTLSYPLLPVMGTALDESLEVHLLGVDAELKAEDGALAGSNRTLYDIPVDVEGGSVDVKLVAGRDNFSQVILTRLIVEQGTDILYKKLGVKRIVGLNFVISDLENGRLRIRESISADPRVESITDLRLENEPDENSGTDRLVTELDVYIRGFSEERSIQAVL